jgi:hypothetical protein
MRRRCRWEDDIKVDLKEIGCQVWIRFSWHRIGLNDMLWFMVITDEPL